MTIQDETRNKNLAKVRELAEKVGQGAGLKFEFEVDFETTMGEHYTGKVEVHRPTIGDYLKMGALKAKLLAQNTTEDDRPPMEYFDNTIKFVAEATATLSVVVDKCPEWLLHPEEIYDLGLLSHVYYKYDEWLNTFRLSSNTAAEASGETTDRA